MVGSLEDEDYPEDGDEFSPDEEREAGCLVGCSMVAMPAAFILCLGVILYVMEWHREVGNVLMFIGVIGLALAPVLGRVLGEMRRRGSGKNDED